MFAGRKKIILTRKFLTFFDLLTQIVKQKHFIYIEINNHPL